MRLTIDFESRSKVDIKRCGGHKYSADPSTEIQCLSVKEDDKPSRIWIPNYWLVKLVDARRTELTRHLIKEEEVLWLVDQADEIEAHNMTGFEQPMWHNICHKRYGWPDLPEHKLRCSAARAAMCSLPRGLGQACAVLGLPVQKDNEGHLVMMRMCKPRKGRKLPCPECIGTGKDFIDASCTVCDGTGKLPGPEAYNEDIDDYIKLCLYCLKDTDAEHALSKALPELPPTELAIFQLDMRANNRGVYLDRTSTAAWIAEIDKAETALLAEWKILTKGKVASPKQIQKTLDFFKDVYKVELKDLAKDTVADALHDLAELS